MCKAIAIGYLIKVSAANVNASYTEGNVIVTKKVTLPDGSTIPYISGQAIRRMLRDRLAELGHALSEPFAEVSGQQVTPPIRPWEYVDEDFFGYLDPKGYRRTSPVRVSAAVGLFPFQGDRDLGTRSFERFGQAMSAGGNIFETELYANLFKGTILVELDRIGVFPTLEIKEKEQKELPIPDRRKRLQDLLEALNILWGGGRTARMLTDLSPKFIAYSRLNVKHPVFLEALSAQYENNKYVLELEPLLNALYKFETYRKSTIFGLEPGVFDNELEIRDCLKNYGGVVSVHEALQKAKKEVEDLWK
ncbi:type I-B CRISPR-associated protein Cas7/Cst2/DevR [Acetomicrobium sp. S15 = DSM 107314]|uniref:type I-B CRISPR-associated protein Cas7/Cst2/DevR n=1 Tax=Acetomicrobium sp. S15 = DSM 107314 TaxID=2529858 RepID=UPI0018E18913|nr:type I-B CRISPR-associated protein Cas7/Cst2/DevR [Acetomicrobium sp. S15 = DSM 107314]